MDEFPDDILLDDDSPDPLTATVHDRSVGRRRSSFRWYVKKHWATIRNSLIAATALSLLGVFAYVGKMLVTEVADEVKSQQAVDQIRIERNLEPTVDQYAPTIPKGPVSYELQLHQILFGQDDSVRSDLEQVIQDGLLDQGLQPTESAGHKIRFVYREVSDRVVSVQITNADGTSSLENVDAAHGHLQVFVKSPDRRDEYQLIAKYFKAAEPVSIGRVKPHSERARRTIRNQMYLQVRDYISKLTFPD